MVASANGHMDVVTFLVEYASKMNLRPGLNVELYMCRTLYK